jgi:hypothetical protein
MAYSIAPTRLIRGNFHMWWISGCSRACKGCSSVPVQKRSFLHPGGSILSVCLPQSIGLCRSSTFAPTSPGARDARRSWIGLSDHPKATRYAIIDDEDDELDELPLFQPSAQTGITMDIVKAAEKYLNGETDKTMRASAVVRLGQNIHSLFKRNKS